MRKLFAQYLSVRSVAPLTWIWKRSCRYHEKECFILTLAGIFNIHAARDFADRKPRKGIINHMTQTDSPYIDQTGAIIIPFNSDPKYHYWNGGQSLSDTLMELNVPENVWKNHTERAYPLNAIWKGLSLGNVNKVRSEISCRKNWNFWPGREMNRWYGLRTVMWENSGRYSAVMA